MNTIEEKVKEYAELTKNIKIIQEKMKILNKQKKVLYTDLLPKLNKRDITKCNLPFGTLKVIETNRKITPNKSTMKDRFTDFFSSRILEQDYQTGTPEQKAEILFKYIYTDSVEYKKDKSISMVYSKEFKEQLKELSE